MQDEADTLAVCLYGTGTAPVKAVHQREDLSKIEEGLPEPPAAVWPNPSLVDPAELEPYLREIGNRMPGGFLPLIWKVVGEHALPERIEHE